MNEKCPTDEQSPTQRQAGLVTLATGPELPNSMVTLLLVATPDGLL